MSSSFTRLVAIFVYEKQSCYRFEKQRAGKLYLTIGLETKLGISSIGHSMIFRIVFVPENIHTKVVIF